MIHTASERRVIIKDAITRSRARRKFADRAFTLAAIGCVILAMIPLGSILLEVIMNGAPAISLEFLSEPPGSMIAGGGGIGPAIQGTIVVVAYASLIGIPVGVLTGVYLSEYGGDNKFANAVRFFNNVMTGLPSIVIGIVAYTALILAFGASFNITAGAFALSIIMIPIIVGVTEETLRLVPNSIREAGHSLGIPKWRVTVSITLMSAKNGVLTGIMLAVSRISGETAPLIMTILGSNLFFSSFSEPVDALPLRIWRLASQPYLHAHDFAWGGALVLIVMVLILNVTLRFLLVQRSTRISRKSRS